MYKITKEIVMSDIIKAADENGWDLNPNPKAVERVRNGIVKNIDKYGERYCPCVIISVVAEEKRKNYICPCVNAKNEIEEDGKCRCNLFWKKPDEETFRKQKLKGL